MRQNRGFSVIEVLLAFTVLTVAILALVGLTPAAARQQDSSGRQNEALYLAQQQMDLLLADPAHYSQPLPSPSPNSPFYVDRNIAPYPVAATGPSVISVNVTWIEGADQDVTSSNMTATQSLTRVRRVQLYSEVAR